MRIKIINPNTTELMTAGIHETALRVARPGTEIVTVNPFTGPSSIEGYFDGALSVIGVMEEVLRSAKGEKVDAFILACFGDPGLEALRELTDIPVVGIAEAAIFLSCFLAPSTEVAYTYPASLREKVTRFAGEYLLDARDFRTQDKARLVEEVVAMTKRRADEMHEVFKEWNEGELKSYLIEITRDILGKTDTDTGKPYRGAAAYTVDKIKIHFYVIAPLDKIYIAY
jgi:Asp/Glu/hydantoin racemase